MLSHVHGLEAGEDCCFLCKHEKQKKEKPLQPFLSHHTLEFNLYWAAALQEHCHDLSPGRSFPSIHFAGMLVAKAAVEAGLCHPVQDLFPQFGEALSTS